MNRVRDLRKEANLSQEELAKKFNLSQQTISSYENGTREPDTETLKQLSGFFNVSIDYLLGHSDTRNPKSDKINETEACYHLDVSGLPKEAIRQVEDYIEFMKQKYNADGTFKKK